MKKKRFIILLSILAAVIVIGCFAYMYFTAAAVKVFFYERCDYRNEDVDTINERLSMFPQQIELKSDYRPGYIARFQDYSLTLSGYKEADIDRELIGDFNIMYHVGNDRHVGNIEWLQNDEFYNGSIQSSWIKKASGRKINNEYDFWEAAFYCIPDDFTLFDADKNKGVCILLGMKYHLMHDAFYQFENGIIKGFMRVVMSPEGIASYVYFSNCEDPDSYYNLVFGDFSVEEVKNMLGTITFDASEAKQ